MAEDNNLNGLIGKVGMCSKGFPGLITERKELPWGLSWVGINLLNGEQWASRNPKMLSINDIRKLTK